MMKETLDYLCDDVFMVILHVVGVDGEVAECEVADGEQKGHEDDLPLARDGKEYVHNQQQVHHVAELRTYRHFNTVFILSHT